MSDVVAFVSQTASAVAVAGTQQAVAVPQTAVHSVRVAGQDVAVQTQTVAVSVQTPSADQVVGIEAQRVQLVTLAQQGPAGQSGVGSVPISAVAAQDLIAGMPVYVDQLNGQLRAGDASVLTRSRVIGLCGAEAATGHVAQAVSGPFALPDWTDVAGTTALSIGQPYFLQTTPGRIGVTAPSTAGASALCVGVAVGAQTLDVFPTVPILL